MKTRKRPITIGIAGGTGAGKTTFAKSIYSACGGSCWDDDADDECNITHLSHDDYYKDLSHLPIEERARVNFDHPSSLDTDLLIQHLRQLLEGTTVIVPRYNYARHCRYREGEVDSSGRSGGRVVQSKSVILVEGILILSVKELVNLMDLKVFVVSSEMEAFVCINKLNDLLMRYCVFIQCSIVIMMYMLKDAPQDIRLLRRIQRDSVERGRTLSDILPQYMATVRPMHHEFVEPSKRNADLIVHGYNEDEDVTRKRMGLVVRVVRNHIRVEAVQT